MIRRVLEAVPVLFIIVTLVFLLVYVAGDPVASLLGDHATPEQVEALRHSLGLDRPLYVQYLDYIWHAIQGDFGVSYRYNQPALGLVLDRLPVTLTLAVWGIVVAIVLSVPSGVYLAVNRGKKIDTVLSSVAVFGKAMPTFWLGIMLILLFAVTLRLVPVSGSGSWQSLILPSVSIAIALAAEIMMLVRSSVIEELNKDYIRTARGKGLPEAVILYGHALRNAFVPVVSIILLLFTSLLGGVIVTETVFAWPGMGLLLVNSVSNRDLPVVQASVFVIAVMVILVNIVGDVVFRLADRRIGVKG
ncbi:MAG: ABC transporter permease [Microbacterium sp.]|uniref:ABC transporter permease n=1 Tax=Microbacterium sp. TaxID=51671 RepID=UPI0039E6987A